MVTFERKRGYVDKAGKIIIMHQFKYSNDFSEGLARVSGDGKTAYIDKTGKIVIRPQFIKDAADFSEGLARVKVF